MGRKFMNGHEHGKEKAGKAASDHRTAVTLVTEAQRDPKQEAELALILRGQRFDAGEVHDLLHPEGQRPQGSLAVKNATSILIGATEKALAAVGGVEPPPFVPEAFAERPVQVFHPPQAPASRRPQAQPMLAALERSEQMRRLIEEPSPFAVDESVQQAQRILAVAHSTVRRIENNVDGPSPSRDDVARFVKNDGELQKLVGRHPEAAEAARRATTLSARHPNSQLSELIEVAQKNAGQEPPTPGAAGATAQINLIDSTVAQLNRTDSPHSTAIADGRLLDELMRDGLQSRTRVAEEGMGTGKGAVGLNDRLVADRTMAERVEAARENLQRSGTVLGSSEAVFSDASIQKIAIPPVAKGPEPLIGGDPAATLASDLAPAVHKKKEGKGAAQHTPHTKPHAQAGMPAFDPSFAGLVKEANQPGKPEKNDRLLTEIETGRRPGPVPGHPPKVDETRIAALMNEGDREIEAGKKAELAREAQEEAARAKKETELGKLMEGARLPHFRAADNAAGNDTIAPAPTPSKLPVEAVQNKAPHPQRH